MKRGMIVYINELQIKFEFRRYRSIFYRVMGLWTQNFHDNLFSGHFWINFEGIKMKLGMIVYNTCNAELKIKSFVVIDQYLIELWPLD
jgi:hypothetical protein